MEFLSVSSCRGGPIKSDSFAVLAEGCHRAVVQLQGQPAAQLVAGANLVSLCTREIEGAGSLEAAISGSGYCAVVVERSTLRQIFGSLQQAIAVSNAEQLVQAWWLFVPDALLISVHAATTALLHKTALVQHSA